MNIESVNLFPKLKFATTVIVILNKTSERERIKILKMWIQILIGIVYRTFLNYPC